ncbi:MAG: DUF4388 domain-containing protein [Nitrospirae bacterium]|nr:MAG: DUF4388 domain-containing protein [Nitrospirota bacterium]
MGLNGRIEDLGIADIFQILSLGKKSGTLWVVSEEGLQSVVVFKNGLVCLAESEAFKDDLVDALLAKGIISKEVLQLVKKVHEDVPDKGLLEVILELDYCDRDTIEQIARKRVAEIAYYLIHMKEGEFRFVPDVVTSDEEIFKRGWMLRKGISPEYLIFESAKKEDEMAEYGQIIEEEELEKQTMDVQDLQTRGLSVLRSMSIELRFPESIQEIYLLILRFASDVYQRGILFTLKEDKLHGFGQFGLTVEDAERKVRETVLPLNQSKTVSDIVERMVPYTGEYFEDDLIESIISTMGEDRPVEIGLFPVVAEQKTVALLYCDCIEFGDERPDSAALEVFISQAGLAIEKALLKEALHRESEKHTDY